jgi:hypothetical protein
MLVKMNNFLNPTIITSTPSIETTTINLTDYLFDGLSCHAESLEWFLTTKLLMFCQHFVTFEECACVLS